MERRMKTRKKGRKHGRIMYMCFMQKYQLYL